MRFGMRCLSSRPGGSQLPAVVLLVGQSMKCQRRPPAAAFGTAYKHMVRSWKHMQKLAAFTWVLTWCLQNNLKTWAHVRGVWEGVTCHWTGRSRWQTWALGCLPRRTPCHEHHEQRLKRQNEKQQNIEKYERYMEAWRGGADFCDLRLKTWRWSIAMCDAKKTGDVEA